MQDKKRQLQLLFDKNSKYSNFGPILSRVKVKGFRGIEEIEINFESPITAISGLNGTGKSTIAQLCACGYKKPSTESKDYKRFYTSQFFPISKADESPFIETAEVEYHYLTNDPNKLQELTLSRQASQWGGYKRQPERHCRYIGFTIYIPKVEQRDISVYRGDQIEISNEILLTEEAKKAISKILSHPYSILSRATASHKERHTEICFAEKFGKKYSENHMGFGEGRIFYTVSSLESAPEQSLFILEEPETSLHEHAQHEFAKYLIDVCIRRKHQIILTTHSRTILNALPKESRKLLYRDGAKVKISNKTSTAESTGALSLGKNYERLILVEDIKAKFLLTEIIRSCKPELLKGLKISFVGNDDVVANLTKQFIEDGINTIGIRDGDRGINKKERLYKLPGKSSPEIEVLNNQNVLDYLNKNYQFDFQSWHQINFDLDYHDWPSEIAKTITKSEEGLWEEISKIYAQNLSTQEKTELISWIEN